jgi:hypothetical protein
VLDVQSSDLSVGIELQDRAVLQGIDQDSTRLVESATKDPRDPQWSDVETAPAFLFEEFVTEFHDVERDLEQDKDREAEEAEKEGRE